MILKNNKVKIIKKYKRPFLIIGLIIWALFLNNIVIADAFINNKIQFENMNIENINKKQFENNLNKYINCITSMANSDNDQKINYPINAIFITTSATDPNTYLDGTWVLFGKGDCLVGQNTADNNFKTLNGVTGTKTKTLAVTNLPEHTHEWEPEDIETEEGGEHKHTYEVSKWYMGSKQSGGQYSWQYWSSTSGAGDIWTSSGGNHRHELTNGWPGTIKNAGSSQPISLLQPYVVVYMWRRTA